MTSRGKNFTEREKCKLLELIQKYKEIIESKCITAEFTAKKNETWEAIAVEFNNTAEVTRTKKQLQTAFLNLKRATRQSHANGNLKKYLDQIKNNVENDDRSHKYIDEKSDLSTAGSEMVTVITEEEAPLSVNCDSASSYYKSDEETAPSDVLPFEYLKQEYNDPPPASEATTETKETQKRIVPQKKKNNDLLKKQFYKHKLECAMIEKKTRLVEYRMMLKKEKLLDLEIKIKEKEYHLLNK